MTRRRLVEFLLRLGVLVALFVPTIPALQPFHPSLALLLAAAIPVVYRRSEVVALAGVVLFSWLGALLASMVYDLPLGIGLLWAALPLGTLLLSALSASRTRPSANSLYRFLLGTATLLAGFVLLQLLRPGMWPAGLYVSPSRAAIWQRYAMVMAPTGNPNNMALILALVLISLQGLCFGKFKTPVQDYLKHHPLQRAWVVVLLAILAIGIVYAYARTVLFALLLAEALFVFTFLSKKNRIRLLVLGAALVLILLMSQADNPWERQLRYYGTILAPTEDTSFIKRYEYYWRNAWEILGSRPILLGTGIGWYEGVLSQVQGSTVTDSSYTYLLLAHGGLISLGLWGIAWRLFRHGRLSRLAVLILVISAVNLPFLSDYRLNLIIGALLGWTYRLDTQQEESVEIA